MRIIFLGGSAAVPSCDRDTTSIGFVGGVESVLIRMLRERDAQRRGVWP